MRFLIITLFMIAAIAGLTTSYFLHRQSFIIDATLPATVETSHVAHYPLTFVMQLKNDPQAGKKIYHEYCSACHAVHPEIPVHAPRINHKQDWTKFKNMPFEDLFKLATLGYGAMPARGGCFECTDQQLKEAIKYLLSK